MAGLFRNVLGKSSKKEDGLLVKVIYATRTGNAQFIAEELERSFNDHQIPCKVVNAIKYSANQLKSDSHVVIICSTFGLGDPTPSAFKLYKELQQEQEQALHGVSYALFGLGDTKYENFCGGGKKIDAELERTGAKAFQPRVDCDLDFGEKAADWIEIITAHFKNHPEFKK